MLNDITAKIDTFEYDLGNFWWYLLVNLGVTLYVIKKCCHHMIPYKHLTDFPANYQEMVLEAYTTYVFDGDGFDFIHIPKFHFGRIPISGTKLRARLAGIDAPEGGKDPDKRQPMADESRRYLEYLILNKRITLKVLSVDKYYRALVVAFADGINVNLEMLKSGYAVIYREHNAFYDRYYQLFNNAEIFAKKRLNGLWHLENKEMPIDFKKRVNNESKYHYVYYAD